MVTVQWSDDSRTSAGTWEELTARVATIQWHVYTAEQMKHVLAKRAYRWSGTPVDPSAGDREFWRQLEKAKLVIIEKDMPDDDERSTS